MKCAMKHQFLKNHVYYIAKQMHEAGYNADSTPNTKPSVKLKQIWNSTLAFCHWIRGRSASSALFQLFLCLRYHLTHIHYVPINIELPFATIVVHVPNFAKHGALLPALQHEERNDFKKLLNDHQKPVRQDLKNKKQNLNKKPDHGFHILTTYSQHSHSDPFRPAHTAQHRNMSEKLPWK
jgi:hypothetical protein